MGPLDVGNEKGGNGFECIGFSVTVFDIKKVISIFERRPV